MARTSTPPPRPHPISPSLRRGPHLRSPSPCRSPHPLTPSPQRGEGERKVSSSSPLSASRRGGQGVGTKVREKIRGEGRNRREGIKGVRTDAERETEIRSEGEDQVHPQAPRLVGPRRARPAMAQDAQSVPRARVRVHAAADTGEPCGGVLSAISRPLPRSRDAGASAAPRSERGLGWAGILCARAESAQAGKGRCTTLRRYVAR